jgi:class 3 adenylate cyclase/DNA-binding winged helix-turn-helix (wHTH) protein/tetratricopeptide (TPR) repeat protein
MFYSFGDYELDTQRHELHRAGEPIKLRRKVFQVLAYLLAYRDRVVPKPELLTQLWPDQFVGDETLTSCITALRRALGERGRTARFVRTLHGQGYRFVGAVAVGESRPADEAPQALPRRGGDGALRQAEGPAPALSPGLADLGNPPRTTVDEEHKQVTVLCGALAEASTLATRLGPEAMHHLMHDVLALAQDTVQHYEGTLAQVSGEGFVALFGAPTAQEDHARRAVLAALELRQRLHAPDVLEASPHGVALRLGLHTGSAVVGPLASEPQRPYLAAGDTLQRATRLQQQAAPDTVLVSATTYALVQNEVQGEACKALALDGPSTPVPVYAIRGILRRQGGVPRRGARPLSRFVGRTEELALLHARLAQVLGGQGQVVGIAGEPGLGKSRLLAEFVHRLRGLPVTAYEGHCLPYGRATPYLPVRDLLRQLWGLPDVAPAATITATVQEQLREAGVASDEEALLLLQLLDVPVDLASLAALDPPERKTRTFAVLRHIVRHASQRQPLLLAVENLHWVDPTSEEWLASLVERLGDIPVLLLTTYRPGYQPPWLRHSTATQMALPRLSPRESRVVLQSVPQATQLPAPLQEAIVTQAAGNAFFVEELTWAALGQGAYAGPLPLPDTIEAVLAARLDRLPPEVKRLVQIAAVIGPEVPVPLVQRVAGLPEDVLQRGLTHLQATEFLYETRLFPEPVYTFKHALTREVAYETLLQERRRMLHAQIVEALEAVAPERLGEQVERIAHHALQGEVWDKAVAYYRQAGTKAEVRSAYREAVACFEQALGALQHLPERRDTIEQAIDIRFDLRSALFSLGAFERIFEHLHEAETLAKALGDRGRLGWAWAYTALGWSQMGELDRALEAGQRALSIATDLEDFGLNLITNYVLGIVNQYLGDHRRAVDLFGKNVDALQGERLREFFGQTGLPAVVHRALIAGSLAELGAFAEGIARGEEGISIAEAADHPYSRALAYSNVGYLYLRKGELQKAISVLEGGLELCQVANFASVLGRFAAHLGYGYALSGRIAEALPLLEQAVGRAATPGNLPRHSLFVACLSEGYLLAGRMEEAITQAQYALALARAQKGRGFEAWALRLLGEIAAHRNPPEIEQAEDHYRQALVLSDKLGMRPLQAHCHCGLGTLYTKTGRQEQARTELCTAIELYRAMEMTFWLPQAEAALAEASRSELRGKEDA